MHFTHKLYFGCIWLPVDCYIVVHAMGNKLIEVVRRCSVCYVNVENALVWQQVAYILILRFVVIWIRCNWIKRTKRSKQKHQNLSVLSISPLSLTVENIQNVEYRNQVQINSLNQTHALTQYLSCNCTTPFFYLKYTNAKTSICMAFQADENCFCTYAF